LKAVTFLFLPAARIAIESRFPMEHNVEGLFESHTLGCDQDRDTSPRSDPDPERIEDTTVFTIIVCHKIKSFERSYSESSLVNE